jgi:hypothetical protein
VRREQLEHAIRTACQIIGHPEVIVMGSQAILGTYSEAELPVAATMSLEVDVLPLGDDEDEVERLGDQIEGAAGEFSAFDQLHGFYIDGIGIRTAILPSGWRDRLVKMQNANTAAPSGSPRFIGWCLEKEDLCVAKLCAHREKDLNFVAALLDHHLVDAALIGRRLELVPAEHSAAAETANAWLTMRHGP